MREIAISSGHGSKVGGAVGILNEVEEARDVVEQVATDLISLGCVVRGPFNDDVSQNQNENLHRITDWHNAQERELDVSVHFNAYVETDAPMGTEVLYVSQEALAQALSAAIAKAGNLIDRGGKFRSDLYVLNHTEKPAVLVEVCFVDSSADVDAYEGTFRPICLAIARTIANWGEDDVEVA